MELDCCLYISVSSMASSHFVGRMQLLILPSMTWVSTLTFQNAFFFRVHPDHNDDGRISSTCCHDSHSGGMLGCTQCMKVQSYFTVVCFFPVRKNLVESKENKGHRFCLLTVKNFLFFLRKILLYVKELWLNVPLFFKSRRLKLLDIFDTGFPFLFFSHPVNPEVY